MAALYKLRNQFSSLRNQPTFHDATRKWEMSAEIPYWFHGGTSGGVAKFQLFSQATTFEWKRHHFSFSVWKFYVMQTVWFWALLGWTDSNSILMSRRGSTLVSSILRKSVRFFVINILFIIKNTFQVETWPISCLNDSEIQDRGLYQVKIQNISWGSLPLGPC